MPVSIRYTTHTFPSPIGVLLLAATKSGICLVKYLDSPSGEANPVKSLLAWTKTHKIDAAVTKAKEDSVLSDAVRAIEASVGGVDGNAKMDSLPVDLSLVGTTFQRSVWKSLRKVPAGTTVTYAELASLSGSPGASRAVGNANRSNPVPIIVPCHRCVASDGLGGYAGATDAESVEIKRKVFLLDVEGVKRSPLGSAGRGKRKRMDDAVDTCILKYVKAC
ncbi:methylated-DNA--cysteine S-met [Gonapodya prolifera JEL478]|uniref:Methylated-DNA--protein-cysteine methyltransferase n=1 Tax=Gonapodya prolifera (strain JEL478) TaxID=1344416 RepID=A0A138ZZB0_GONPJ|nr:methylated-DNA--cysteine S-met [Gonapodya prolifera JEL478]|eukprot:KXS09830.1 methylated-DNA--cysteine S-met [Gonapodya prolifera JEL478]